MATQTSRKARGRATEEIVAEALRADGWPYAQRIGASAAGCDITGTPGIGWEVKARREFDPTGVLRQAVRNAGLLVPMVVLRPDGYGPASVDDWPAFTTFAWARRLLRAAGYGDPLTAQNGGVVL